jgi:hypothetical protein
VLRRIFGPKRIQVKGGRRKLHNEELHNLYFSPNIIRMIKSMRMRCTGHVARMWAMRNYTCNLCVIDVGELVCWDFSMLLDYICLVSVLPL